MLTFRLPFDAGLTILPFLPIGGALDVDAGPVSTTKGPFLFGRLLFADVFRRHERRSARQRCYCDRESSAMLFHRWDILEQVAQHSFGEQEDRERSGSVPGAWDECLGA